MSDKKDMPVQIGDEPIEGLTSETFLELIDNEIEITVTMYQLIMIQNDMMQRVVRYASQRDNPDVDQVVLEFNIENCTEVVDTINNAQFTRTVRERLGMPRKSIPDDFDDNDNDQGASDE